MKRFLTWSAILALTTVLFSACGPTQTQQMVDEKECGTTTYQLHGRLAYSASCGEGDQVNDAFFAMNQSGTHILHASFYPAATQVWAGERLDFYTSAVLTDASGTILQDYLCHWGTPEGAGAGYFEVGFNPFNYSVQVNEPTEEVITCFEVGALENANRNYLVARASVNIFPPPTTP